MKFFLVWCAVAACGFGVVLLSMYLDDHRPRDYYVTYQYGAKACGDAQTTGYGYFVVNFNRKIRTYADIEELLTCVKPKFDGVEMTDRVAVILDWKEIER